MTETVITWAPAFVPVANDRGTVRGALVTVSRAGVEHVGTVIQPQGIDLSSWVGSGLLGDATEVDGHTDNAVVDILAHAANEGAAGRSGSRTLGGADCRRRVSS